MQLFFSVDICVFTPWRINFCWFAIKLNCFICSDPNIISLTAGKIWNCFGCCFIIWYGYSFMVFRKFFIRRILYLVTCCLGSLLIPFNCKAFWNCSYIVNSNCFGLNLKGLFYSSAVWSFKLNCYRISSYIRSALGIGYSIIFWTDFLPLFLTVTAGFFAFPS